jgi:hypothetical protein
MRPVASLGCLALVIGDYHGFIPLPPWSGEDELLSEMVRGVSFGQHTGHEQVEIPLVPEVTTGRSCRVHVSCGRFGRQQRPRRPSDVWRSDPPYIYIFRVIKYVPPSTTRF